MKIRKKWKILSASVAGLMSVGLVVGSTYSLLSASNGNKSLVNTNSTNLNADATTTTGVAPALTSYNAYSGLETITNRIGPMLISNNGQTFGNYDWYGNLNWSITLNSANTGLYPGSGTKVVDWNYVADKDYLYVITDTAYLFCIDSTTGDVIANVPQSTSGIPTGSNKLATIALNTQLYVWNSNTTSPQVCSVDRTTLKVTQTYTNLSSDLSGKYLLNILQLSNDPGFNIAITSTTAPTSNITSVTAYFVTNSLTAFTSSTGSGSVPSQQISLSSITSSQNLYMNAFYYTLTNSYILIVGNSLYNVSLSTNAMEKSSFTAFSNGSISIQNINSGFVDGSGDIYFTDSSKKIYTVNADGKSVSQYYTLSSISYLSSDVSSTSATIQIFPVENSTGTLLQGQIYVATTNANFGGISNKTAAGSAAFNSSSVKPTINVVNQSSFNNLIPSAVTYNNFSSSNSDALTASSMQFTVDDKNGTLAVKASLTKSAWYSTSTSEKTTSIINANYNLQKASGVTSWASQATFAAIGNGYFANKSPNQISTEDFDKYSTQVLIISSSLESAVQSGSLQRTFVITNVGNDNTITVMATVSYVDQYGTFVTYSAGSTTYTVKSASDTKFAFQGQTNYIANQTIDVSTVAALSTYKGYLPSLLSQDDLINFIATEDGYPTSSQRRIISANADDNSGKLTLNVVFIGISTSTPNNFTVTYTGFPTFASSVVKWNGTNLSDLLANEESKPEDARNQTLIDQINLMKDSKSGYGDQADSIIDITTIPSYVNYGTILSTTVSPTQVNLVYSTLLSNMGFQPSLTIERTAMDNEFGVITIKLDYTNSVGTNGEKLTPSFLQSLGIVSGTGDNQQIGVITQKFSGFLPIGSTYGVTLKDSNSTAVQKVINDNNVDSIIPDSDLLNTLNIKGYNTDGSVDILSTSWNGEKLTFQVRAQSANYPTVNGLYNFTIDWAPKFASIRERNLIIAVVVSIVGVAIVAGAIAAYVMRKNKIRRLLK